MRPKPPGARFDRLHLSAYDSGVNTKPQGEQHRETWDKQALRHLLPYDDPFLFMDRVLTVEPDRLTAEWEAAPDAFFFRGHFTGFPVVPAAILFEGMGQAASLLFRHAKGMPADTDILLHTLKDAHMRTPAFPGDLLHYEVRMQRSSAIAARFAVRAWTAAAAIGDAEILLAMTSRTAFRSTHRTGVTVGENSPVRASPS